MKDKATGRGASIVALVVFATALAGCGGKDHRPKYTPPDLSASEAAILKANNDYWISEVDGARIDAPGVKFLVQPGNTVKVAPGDRTIVVTRSGNSSLVQTGGGHEAFWKFTYPFKAGRTYRIKGGGSAVNPAVKVVDTQTGTETEVGG